MESVNCQTEENRPEDIKFPQIIRKTTFATLQTTNMLMNNSFFPENIKIMLNGHHYNVGACKHTTCPVVKRLK